MFLLRSALIVIHLLVFKSKCSGSFLSGPPVFPKRNPPTCLRSKLLPASDPEDHQVKGLGLRWPHRPSRSPPGPRSTNKPGPGESHPFLEQRWPSAPELENTRLQHPVPPPHTSSLGPLPQPHVRRSHWLNRSSSYISCLASNCPFVFSSFFLPLWVHVL